MKRRQPSSRRSGFTLLELLIVLAIIVAIAAMVAPNLLSSQQDANIMTTRTTIKTIEDAFKRKAVKNNGVFDIQGGSADIQALTEQWEDSLGQQQQPLLEELPMDAWNHEFQVSYDSGDLKPKIWSFGPDGEDGNGSHSTDDVSNLRRDIE
ncbi:MAG TPA: prepilin-type N-terminal cleavage/methylation domain-containing protein [Planctomycetes bacterium]|nr:prepilin-type N-terminal cleavage/methylation domain-containing protein [Planctomycetota bacterium]